MSLIKKIFKNTFYQLLSKVITSLLGLVIRKLLTSYLGPAGFGDYIYFLTYATLFGSIADWGTITISVREASRYPENQAKIFGSSLTGRLLLSIVAFAIALISAPFLMGNNYSTELVFMTCLLIVAMATKASFGIIFESLLKMSNWLYIEVTASLCTLLLYFLATVLHLPLLYFISFLFIATLISILVGIYLAQKNTPIDFHPHWPTLRHIIKESFPMGLALIMFSIYNRIDTLILAKYRSSIEVGFYGLAYFVYENIVLIAAYILNSIYPILSHTAVSLKSDFVKIFKQYYVTMLALGIMASIATYFLSPVFIWLLATKEFLPSIQILKVLSISLIFSYLNHSTGYSLIALGYQRPYTYITLTALMFNVLANVYVIPIYGFIGSAWVTVGTEFIVQVLSLFLINKLLKSVHVK